VFGVRDDQVVVDRRRGGEAGCGGADDLRLDVRHVARDPDARLGRGTSGVGLDLGAQQVAVQAHLGGLHPKGCQQLGAGPADRRHDECVQLDADTVGQPNTGQPTGGRVDLDHNARNNRNANGCKTFLLLRCQWRPYVLQQSDLGAELAEHQRLMDRERPGGQNPDVLVADFPAVAVRAVQHVDTPTLGQAGDVGELVAGTCRDEDPARTHRPIPDLDSERTTSIYAVEGVDVAVEDLPSV